MINPPKTKLDGNQGSAGKQRSQLKIAFAFLIVALAVLLVRDREFWFGPEPTESDSSISQSAPTSNPAPLTAKSTPAPVAPAVTPLAPNAPTVSSPSAAAHQNSRSTTKIRAAKPTVLPALKVEVVAGNSHHTAQPVRETTKLKYSTESKLPSEAVVLPTNAAQIEPLTRGAVPEIRQTLDSTYPLLGPRMKVQGSVVLQAVIGADGNIENLRVVSGPSILTAAAQQAVRQWRFKPYMQNGEPVETKATITVNFSIRISDDAAAKIS